MKSYLTCVENKEIRNGYITKKGCYVVKGHTISEMKFKRKRVPVQYRNRKPHQVVREKKTIICTQHALPTQ